MFFQAGEKGIFTVLEYSFVSVQNPRRGELSPACLMLKFLGLNTSAFLNSPLPAALSRWLY